MEEKEFQKRVQNIEGLVRKIEALTDSEARASAIELMQSLMDLHGAGLERMMEITWEAGEPGRGIIDGFARDDLVGSLLLLYGLHPLDLEARVAGALNKVGPYLRSQGGSAELLGVTDGRVRIRLERSTNGCASTAQALKQAVEEAIYEAAPDLTSLELETAAEQPLISGFVPLENLRGKSGAPIVQQSVRAIEKGGHSNGR
jgi:Fe-S cluster biogenesis protein NfuA